MLKNGFHIQFDGPIAGRTVTPLIAWQNRWNERELKHIDEFVPANRTAVDVGMWWGPWSWGWPAGCPESRRLSRTPVWSVARRQPFPATRISTRWPSATGPAGRRYGFLLMGREPRVVPRWRSQ